MGPEFGCKGGEVARTPGIQAQNKSNLQEQTKFAATSYSISNAVNTSINSNDSSQLVKTTMITEVKSLTSSLKHKLHFS